MALKGGSDRAVDVARREAAEWIARMTGPDAEMSRLDFERWRSRSPLNRRLYGEMQQISAL
jgi:ferric-dicitrate binding protein FerR (iron transport regulator)